MKTAALDVGDVWIGIALSDGLGMFARPHTTVKAPALFSYLTSCIQEHGITTIVVGHPQTLKGTASEQTRKVEAALETYKQAFPNVTWALWDERLTSKQASHIKRGKTKEKKLEQHAVAAALILQSYLDHASWKRAVNSN